jgi:hypothetical protein
MNRRLRWRVGRPFTLTLCPLRVQTIARTRETKLFPDKPISERGRMRHTNRPVARTPAAHPLLALVTDMAARASRTGASKGAPAKPHQSRTGVYHLALQSNTMWKTGVGIGARVFWRARDKSSLTTQGRSKPSTPGLSAIRTLAPTGDSGKRRPCAGERPDTYREFPFGEIDENEESVAVALPARALLRACDHLSEKLE